MDSYEIIDTKVSDPPEFTSIVREYLMSQSNATKAPYTFVLNERTRILAVDDDPIQREFAAVYLATPSAVIDTAESAEAGLRMLGEGDYDIVLLDIDMPGFDGIAMLETIRASAPLANLPVVMVTGSEDIISIDRAYDAGATSFITKPVNWRLLSYHLRFVLRSRDCVRKPDGAAHHERRDGVSNKQ
jgi:DNA-binding response OmpR family regulator